MKIEKTPTAAARPKLKGEGAAVLANWTPAIHADRTISPSPRVSMIKP